MVAFIAAMSDQAVQFGPGKSRYLNGTDGSSPSAGSCEGVGARNRP